MKSQQGFKTIFVVLFIWSSIILTISQAQKTRQLILLKDIGDYRDAIDLWKKDWDVTVVTMDRNNKQESRTNMCEALAKGGNLVLDYTYHEGWTEVKDAARSAGLVYIRIKTIFSVLHQAADEFLVSIRKARDSALIFQYPYQMEESLYYLVHESPLRVILFDGLQGKDVQRLQDMRPSPSYYLLFANTRPMNSIFKTAAENKLTKLNDRWNLVFTDFSYQTFDRNLTSMRTIAFTVNTTFCCGLHTTARPCNCNPSDNLEELLTETAMHCINEAVSKTDSEPISAQCKENYNSDPSSPSFYRQLQQCLKKTSSIRLDEEDEISADLQVDIQVWRATDPEVYIASWTSNGGVTTLTDIPPIKRFFRIGTGFSIPFGYPLIERGKEVLDEEGNQVWVGYCIDLINKLSELMEFDYELITSYDFGEKNKNGTWTGLVGMLAYAKIDVVVAPLTMTSEREEVIDFIAPYFEQTGLSIVIRKPVREVSLFKFMTVLKVEVWLSILAALVSTAIMIWFLDKYSPYSARNNKQLYPYPCRDFTLKESFWFAVTSFTPQGGGEAPKPLSARTLVAAYWLFVVLMLATFTANLAAFLTVERMQSPVQSLEQLAKQSRINYTVVKDSIGHMYFNNMKHAEDTLYRVWKEITLNASSDQTQYRVWDYPIKEQYSRILLAILKTGTVSTPEEGYAKVLESEQGEFALIHDALEIKYQVDRNCNITEIGEPFAEQPYAIAVQQGSQLNEEISRKILDLQRDRYLEELTAKYWNASLKGECNDIDENEGITLESLGGVFIATLVGLGLAMITLGVEVFYQKKKDKKTSQIKAVTIEGKSPTKTVPNKNFIQNKDFMLRDELFTAREFGISFSKKDKKSAKILQPPSNISFISTYPRGQLY